MLDTCICSFIMREHPLPVLKKLQYVSGQQHRIVISAITYAEMRYGAIGKKASPKHTVLINEFMECVDAVLPWGVAAVDCSSEIKKALAQAGTPIGANDTAIAGHALSEKCTLVTNNTREFSRVNGLIIEDWVVSC
jgi:tRNA(fMet)-specific endonuclease VapC